jgi:hypothetical protein
MYQFVYACNPGEPVTYQRAFNVSHGTFDLSKDFLEEEKCALTSQARQAHESPRVIFRLAMKATKFPYSPITDHRLLITSPLRLRPRRFYYRSMYRFCFRITFQNEEAAFYQFHVFPPVVYLPWVSGWARKRNASSQLILVELTGDNDRDRFLELCCENPHVLKIEEISEDEFTASPSHTI